MDILRDELQVREVDLAALLVCLEAPREEGAPGGEGRHHGVVGNQ